MAILQATDQVTDSTTGERPNVHESYPDGPEGVAATLSAMVRLTKIYRSTTAIRDAAERIISGVGEKDYWKELAAVQAWVRDAVRYTRDVFDVETLKTPLETLRSMTGDCDDKALLAGALLQSIGVKVRYVAVGNESPGEFDHVYVEARMGDHWVGVETTEQVPLGWRPDSAAVRPMIANV